MPQCQRILLCLLQYYMYIQYLQEHLQKSKDDQPSSPKRLSEAWKAIEKSKKILALIQTIKKEQNATNMLTWVAKLTMLIS